MAMVVVCTLVEIEKCGGSQPSDTTRRRRPCFQIRRPIRIQPWNKKYQERDKERILPRRETVGAMKPLDWVADRETTATTERARY
mgnify:CR=1 FL=1